VRIKGEETGSAWIHCGSADRWITSRCCICLRKRALYYIDEIDLISESRQKEIKKATGVKDEDAFHLTAAIEGKTEYFITVDDNILTKADTIERYGIKVRNPANLDLEEAENGYGSRDSKKGFKHRRKGTHP